MKKTFALALASLCGLATSAYAQPTVWNFDTDFTPAVAGPATMDWYNGGIFGTFGTDTIDGGSTGVLNLDAGLPGQALAMFANVAGNGGSPGDLYINQYTVIYDIKESLTNPFMCYFNTAGGTGNDGDAFRNPAGGIGISGDYEGVIQADTWHRVAFVIDTTLATGDRMRKYIDGQFVGATGLGGLDGRHALYSSADPTFPSLAHFGDNSSDTSPVTVSSILFEARAYTTAEIAALGCATATGISIGAPRTCSAPPTATAALSATEALPGDTLLLTAAVAPGAFPASTSYTVVADLTDFDLAASVAMLDDGLNGDVAVNDRIFSVRFTIPATVTPGTKSADVLVTDNLGRNGSASDSLFVNDPTSGTNLTIIDFNNAATPLANTTGPGVMEFWDRVLPGNTEAITQFGTTSSFSIPGINGIEANVAFLPRFFGDEGLRFNNLSPGNGGGLYVNQYTLIADIYFPA
ncbi:MAG: hypothetical protein ACOYN0_16075, partial [Phycisphaerales bacterium]